MTDARRAAELAADVLLKNGAGQVADRLVLTDDATNRDLGGWCRGAIVDQLTAVFYAALAPRSIRAAVTLRCTSMVDGRQCNRTATYTCERSGVDPFAEARHDGWMMRDDAARCRECGNAARSFGSPR